MKQIGNNKARKNWGNGRAGSEHTCNDMFSLISVTLSVYQF